MKILKRVLYIFLILLGLVMLFVLCVMSTTGFFRSIEGDFSDKLISKIEIPGAEDIVIDAEGTFLIVSSDDRAAHRDGKKATCGLYYYDLNTHQHRLLYDGLQGKFHPHGIDMHQLDSTTFRILVVNHFYDGEEFSLASTTVQHSIEEFVLEDGILRHIETYSDEWIKSPNDVVITGPRAFYFSNDHGSDTALGLFAEDYLGFSRSGAVYYDGATFREVADGIAYANGINIDEDRKLLYIASPRKFLIKVYQIMPEGDLSFVEDIPCGTGVDNIDIDASGALWVGCHPNLLHFAAYAEGKEPIAPSEVIRITYAGTGDYMVESLMEEDGSVMSGTTTAISHKGELYLGNVMDKAFVRMRQ